MIRPQPDVTAVTKQRLIDAFWSVYETKRIEQIRVKEITDLANCHRGTFYEYFNDVYDLLDQEEQSIIDQIKDNAPIIQSSNMEDVLKLLTGIYTTNGKHISLLLGEGGDPEFIRKFKEALFPAFLTMNELPNSQAITVIYEFGVGGMLRAFQHWYTSKDQLPMEDYIRIVRSLVQNGILRTLETVKQ